MNRRTEPAPESSVVGEALLALRRRAGLTQEQVIALAGGTAPALSRIEKGERDPRWSTLTRLLAAIGADFHQLADEIVAIERQGPPGT